jgi:hypothetical protein
MSDHSTNVDDKQTALDLDRAVRAAASELQEAMALKCGDLADRIMGRPELGTAAWLVEHGQRGTPEGKQRLAEWYLVKMRIYIAAGLDPTGSAINARKAGASWDAIGDACDMTSQAAQDRWEGLIPDA